MVAFNIKVQEEEEEKVMAFISIISILHLFA